MFFKKTRLPFFVRRFVAGTDAADAVAVARELSHQSIAATIDLLGEGIVDRQHCEGAAQAYVQLLEALHTAGLLPYISIKLSMLGLDRQDSLCYDLAALVVRKADDLNGRVCLDMEGSATTERTLQIYERLCSGHASPEIVLQAYLHRTREDIHRVLGTGGKLRLCKGAYKEPRDLALQKMTEIRDRYLELLETLLAKGRRVAIATHDDALIQGAEELIGRADAGKPLDPERYEFQMLYGLRAQTWSKIRARGHNFTVYIPYGMDWRPYYQRRLAERKENVFFILQNFWRH
jgi:proline dehydrogenase